MIKKAIVYIFLVFICLSTSGIVLDKDVIQINNGYQFIGGEWDDTINHYIIVEEPVGNVSIISDNGNAINNMVTIDDGMIIYSAVVGSDGYIYISTNSGIWKRKSGVTAPQFSSDTDTDFILISTDKPSILLAKEAYIYYNTDTDIKKINLNTLIVNTVTTIPVSNIFDFDVVSDSEMYFLNNYHIANTNFVNVTDESGNVILSNFVNAESSAPTSIQGSIQYINSEAIYYGVNYRTDVTTYTRNANIINDTGGIVDDWGFIGYDAFTTHVFKSFYIGQNAYTAAVKVGDQIEIIATEDKSTSIITLPAALIYDEAYINSQYTTYYNNSDLYMNVFLDIDLSDNDISFAEIPALYQYEIDLIDSNGVQTKNNIIYTPFAPVGIIDKHATLTTTQKYTGTFINGSWSANLYEVNKTTKTRALLDTTSFEILNTSSTSTIGQPIETEGTIFDRVINNENFGALIIIVAFIGIFASIGAKQEGDKTIMGAFMGFVVGVFVGFMAGLVPLWIVLSMVLVSIGLIASGVSNKMG